jgi:branched-chain amino acid transport system substrate-binding protein
MSGLPGQITNFVGYACGTAGPANSKLAPVQLGWVNNQGGSIISNGPEATAAVQVGVNWINKYGGGIDGHPLKLDTCFVKNAEQEGLGCAEGFLANKAIKAVVYGAVGTGANTINAALTKKLPIIEGFAQNPSDVHHPGTYIVYVASPFDFYGWGTFAKEQHAKTAAVLYESGGGLSTDAEAAAYSMRKEGINVKLVGFAANSTDLVGAFTAAGANTADVVAPLVVVPSECISTQEALTQLGVNPNKVDAIWTCALDSEKASYPGGDLPHWWYGEAQSGDGLTTNPEGLAFKKALTEFGAASFNEDAWYSGMFGLILTIDRWMNQIGYQHLTSAAIAQKAKTFRGPVLLGEPVVVCGKYPAEPADCGDGDRFFQYHGNGSFTEYPKWVQTPCIIQKSLRAKNACKGPKSLLIN